MSLFSPKDALLIQIAKGLEILLRREANRVGGEACLEQSQVIFQARAMFEENADMHFSQRPKLEREPVQFEGLGMCYYTKIGKRCPLKGEYYLSGAIPEAYRAPNDLMTEYWVVAPINYARKQQGWERGSAVQVTEVARAAAQSR